MYPEELYKKDGRLLIGYAEDCSIFAESTSLGLCDVISFGDDFDGGLGVYAIVRKGYKFAILVRDELEIGTLFFGDDVWYDSIRVFPWTGAMSETDEDGIFHDHMNDYYVIAGHGREYIAMLLETSEDQSGYDMTRVGRFTSLRDALQRKDEMRFFCDRPEINICSDNIQELSDSQVFVFGSNREGRHLDGAAGFASRNFGAKMGVGVGPTGQCYAIPTMDGDLSILKEEAEDFLAFAKEHPEKEFLLTRVGCGVAHWTDDDIAPLFKGSAEASNILVPMEWNHIIHRIRIGDEIGLQLVDTGGRSDLEAWMGIIAVAYAVHKKIVLSFDIDEESRINVMDEGDYISNRLVDVVNAQRLSAGRVQSLSSLYTKLKTYRESDFQRWYKTFVMTDLFNNCTDLANGTVVNPDRTLCRFINLLLEDKGCKRIYNPLSGVGMLYLTGGVDYVCQEPSSLLLLVQLVLAEVTGGRKLPWKTQFLEGDFVKDWHPGHGFCDALATVLPVDYATDRMWSTEAENAIRLRSQRIASQMLHNMTMEEKHHRFKAAAIVVNEDVLVSSDFKNYRRAILNSGHLERIVDLGDSAFSGYSGRTAIMVLDFTRTFDHVLFNSEYAYKDVSWTNVSEMEAEDYQMISAPVSRILAADVCLLSTVYNEHYEESVSACPAMPLKNVLTLKEPEPPLGMDCMLANPFGTSFIFKDAVHHFPCRKVTAGMSYSLYSTPCLLMNERGVMLLRETIQVGVVHCVNDVMYGISDDMLPEYLVMQITNEEFRFMVGEVTKLLYKGMITKDECARLILSWYIRVPEGGLEPQRGYVEDHMRALLPDDARSYNVVLFGNVDTVHFGDMKIDILYQVEECGEPGQAVRDAAGKSKVQKALDAVIVNAEWFQDDGFFTGLREVMGAFHDVNAPIYVVNSLDAAKLMRPMTQAQRDYLKADRIFAPEQMTDLLKALRAELDKSNSPEAKVRNQYAKELKAAAAIDERWPELKAEDSILSFLLRYESSDELDECFARIRQLRDGIFDRLKQRNVLPADLGDEGALAAFLADRVYTINLGRDRGAKVYYLTGRIGMDSHLAEGIRFLSRVSNKAIHEGGVDNGLAMSVVHILMMFVSWVRSQFEEGGIFAEEGRSGGYWISTDNLGIFEAHSPATVVLHRTTKDGRDYWYAGQYHVKTEEVSPKGASDGAVITVTGSKAERQPYVTDDIHALFLATDWEVKK